MTKPNKYEAIANRYLSKDYTVVYRNGRGKRQWMCKRRSELAQARALVATANPDAPQTIDSAVKAVHEYSLELSSDQRLAGLIKALCEAPAAVFWPVLLEHWMHCDSTWNCTPELLMLIQHHVATGHPAEHWQAAEARAFLKTLPLVVTVYRGCSRPRINGISWTIDRSVAETFARGHRGIAVPDPVVATGTIARDRILAVFNERNESEVLLDPRDLKGGAS